MKSVSNVSMQYNCERQNVHFVGLCNIVVINAWKE